MAHPPTLTPPLEGEIMPATLQSCPRGGRGEALLRDSASHELFMGHILWLVLYTGPAVFHFLFSFSWLCENVLENPMPGRKESLGCGIMLRIEDSDCGPGLPWAAVSLSLGIFLPICKMHVGGEIRWTVELTGVCQTQVPVNSIRPRLWTLLAGWPLPFVP